MSPGSSGRKASSAVGRISSADRHLARLNTMKVVLNSVPWERLDPTLDFVPDSEIIVPVP